jgi:hypothetical protein
VTKQEQTALNMVKFIQAKTLRLLENFNDLKLDDSVDECERLHEQAEQLGSRLERTLNEGKENQETTKRPCQQRLRCTSASSR